MTDTPTRQPAELDALLQRARQLRAEAAARQFAALGRWLRRGPVEVFRRRPRRRGCPQAA